MYAFAVSLRRSPVADSERSSPRVARRRERMRSSLLAAGARQFAARGVAHVSVAELIAEADVSRATFYAFFSSKYNLLEGILNPIFEQATAAFRALRGRPPESVVGGIVDTYVDLWGQHRDGLLLIPLVDAETFRHFESRHRELNDALLDLLRGVERAGLLRNASAEYSLRVLARTAVPLLRVYDGHPAARAAFGDAIRGLLLRAH